MFDERTSPHNVAGLLKVFEAHPFFFFFFFFFRSIFTCLKRFSFFLVQGLAT